MAVDPKKKQQNHGKCIIEWDGTPIFL